MPVLVRWQQGDAEPATVRCSQVRPHPLLPAHLQLVGVRGANDPDHPDLHVVALTVRVADVVYLCDCAPAEQKGTPAPAVEPEPAPQPEPRRARRTRRALPEG